MNQSLDVSDVTKAAQITVVFTMLYTLTFVNGLVSKKRFLRQARRANKKFDRYSSPLMQSADRLQANFLEWSPIFLGLLWSLAATENLSKSSGTVIAAWMYLKFRALYVVLVLRHGMAADGMNRSLWMSTMPAYLCLMFLAQQAIRTLLL